MAINWGPWNGAISNRFRLGIEVVVNETTLVMFATYHIESQVSTANAMTLTRSGPITGNVNFTAASPTPKQVASGVAVIGERGMTYLFGAGLTGAPGGASPVVFLYVTIPILVPDPPDIATVGTVTYERANLSGTAPASDGGAAITAYEWEMADNGAFSNKTSSVVPVSEPGGGLVWNSIPVRRATQMHFRYRGINSAGGGAWSSVRNFTPPATTPTLGYGPWADQIGWDSARFTYDANYEDDGGSAILERQIQIALDDGFVNIVSTTTHVGGNRIAGLSGATAYFMRARARNALGWSGWSPSNSFTTSATVPANPAGPVITEVRATSASATWNTPSSNGSPITGYEVQISTGATFPAGATTQTYEAGGTGYNFTGLTPNTVYWVRSRAKNLVGWGSYSATVNFDTFGGVPTLESIPGLELAASGGTTPTRQSGAAGARVRANAWTGPINITVQVATDPIFTAGLQTINGIISITLGAANIEAPTLQAPGTYYVRARAQVGAYTTAWSSVYEYRQVHAPSAALVSPVRGRYIATAPDNTLNFQWKFLDPALTEARPLDGQTTYQIRVENNATGALVYAGPTTAMTSSTPDQVLSAIVVLAWPKDVSLRWRVTVADKNGTLGVSPWANFHMGDPPEVVAFQPVEGSTVNTGTPVFSWSTNRDSMPGAAITTIAESRVTVWRAGDGVEVWSQVARQNTRTIQPTSVILQNGVSYVYTVECTDTRNLKGYSTRTFTASFVAPPTVQFTVESTDSSVGSLGAVYIDWSSTSPDPFHVAWTVYRRKLGESEWERVAVIPDIAATGYSDWLAEGKQVYQYSVTQTASRSGALMESVIGYQNPNPSATIVNLVENPSFEPAATGYAMLGNLMNAGASSAVAPFVGSLSLRMTTPASAPSSTSGVTYDIVGLTPGEFLAFSARVLNSRAAPAGTYVANQRVRTAIIYKTEGGAVIGSASYSSYTMLTAADVWTRVSRCTVIPANAYRATLQVQFTGTASTPPAINQAFHMDAVMAVSRPTQAEAEAIVQTYFDGDTVGTPDTAYAWLGYAHNSQSTKQARDVIDTRNWLVDYEYYWLVLDDGIEKFGTRLKSVTSDSFKEEFETATYNVIGRGRHRDEGTRFGYTGTLTLQLRGPNAGEARMVIQALRATQQRLYLRTPFGDYFPVALGDVSVDRLAGVADDMSDITLPYEEVY